VNPRRRWVWVGYWAGVALLALVLLGVSGQVLTLERAEARGRAETARQEASRLALWRMDSWLAPVLAREARRPYFEYRAVLPAGRAYENMWAPIGEGEPVVASALIAGVPEDERATGPSGERLIRLHLQIEPDGVVTSPQHPSDSDLVDLVQADPLVAANTAGRDRAGAMLAVLSPMIEPTVAMDRAYWDEIDSPDLGSTTGGVAVSSLADLPNGLDERNRAMEPGEGKAESFEVGEYAARSQVAQLAQQAEAPSQQVYTSNAANRLEEGSRLGRGAAQAQARTKIASALEKDTEPVVGGAIAPASAAIDGLVSEAENQTEAENKNKAREMLAADESRADGVALFYDTDQADDAGRFADEAPQGADATGTDSLGNLAQSGAPIDPASEPADGPSAEELKRLNAYSYATLGDSTEFVGGAPGLSIRVGALRPRWLRSASGNPELIYLREVNVEGETYQQGVWFDWTALRAALLAVSPGLPAGSTIDAVSSDFESAGFTPAWPIPQRRLATVPAVLSLPPMVGTPLGMTPARWSLVLTWFAVLASVGAIGVVLRTAMRLSDRRVRFVGAVTHELRTPLTTFRLYSQMLADGMVTEESARREYLVTLKQESARLAGIVENVLAYARLNRAGRDQHRVRTEAITPEALLVRLRPGLSRRAEQSSMDLIVSNEAGDQDAGGGRELMVDPQSVERVLTNLVDNACKYAAPSGEDDPDAETRIHLDLRVMGENLEILVADYGPGIDSADRGKVFGEFQRGRAGQRADRSGLGLGLALSRGLARESGGDLRLVRRRGHGAEFLLTLPMQPAAEQAG
jgi:signal transduction histidine kinase